MSTSTNFIRGLNGYRLLYLPDHPRAMKTRVWDGYVYEHIVVAEAQLRRRLLKTEVVHHLNGDRANNRRSNLLVLDRGQHSKLHTWLSAGAFMSESLNRSGNALKSKERSAIFCVCCGRTLQGKQTKSCSTQCHFTIRRKVVRPTKELLQIDVDNMSMVQVGLKYCVSDNAVRKWLKSYGIRKTV